MPVTINIEPQHARARRWLAASCIMSALLLAVPTLWASIESADAVQVVQTAQQTADHGEQTQPGEAQAGFDWGFWGFILAAASIAVPIIVGCIRSFIKIRDQWAHMNRKIRKIDKRTDKIDDNVEKLLLLIANPTSTVLINEGVDVSVRDKDGRTALSYAVPTKKNPPDK